MKISDLTELLGGSYQTPKLTHAYVCKNIKRETIKTSQWILMDDAVRDRVKQNAQLTSESAKIMRSLYKSR